MLLICLFSAGESFFLVCKASLSWLLTSTTIYSWKFPQVCPCESPMSSTSSFCVMVVIARGGHGGHQWELLITYQSAIWVMTCELIYMAEVHIQVHCVWAVAFQKAEPGCEPWQAIQRAQLRHGFWWPGLDITTWVMDHELWVMSCGLWVVGCGLWVVGCELWVVSCGLWVVGCELWIVSCGLWVVGCGLWVMGHGFVETFQTSLIRLLY